MIVAVPSEIRPGQSKPDRNGKPAVCGRGEEEDEDLKCMAGLSVPMKLRTCFSRSPFCCLCLRHSMDVNALFN